MTVGDLYYIDKHGNQQLASKDIELREAKKQVRQTEKICNHINFSECRTVIEAGNWSFKIQGKGWKTLK